MMEGDVSTIDLLAGLVELGREHFTGAIRFESEGVSGLDPWREDIAALAASPRVHCKLSGLVTEASDRWQIEDLRPYVDHLLGTFGANKLIWGSDWPVVERGGGYDRWRAASLSLLDGLDARARDAVLGGNAAQVYLQRGVRA